MKNIKKVISLLLAMLLFAASFAVAAHAEVQPFPVNYTIQFALSDKNDGTGATIVKTTKVILPAGSELKTVGKLSEYDSYVEGSVKYYFAGWRDQDSGKIYASDRLPNVSGDKIYLAVFEADEEVEGGITFFKFLSYVFSKINDVFEYFWRIFFEERH